jgi:hypothetical protein
MSIRRDLFRSCLSIPMGNRGWASRTVRDVVFREILGAERAITPQGLSCVAYCNLAEI